ncbi:hypothetical protein K1T71_001147 [Dendrolimus kikuchii]|uniref:Uncharacterized protein n=1 Tax=Dendrolimus kikuchii TaxID=765133 RepID=A0ACC1DH37_9NEOP|nr:hypothetical protein K1T71_001147 [Dendrolimus kikuchii]
MSVNIDMETFPAKNNLRRRTLNTLKSAVTALKQIANVVDVMENSKIFEQEPNER